MTLPLSVNTLPKVIFLDAMGTIFDLRSSVGEIYQQYALKYGVKADAKLLNNAFIHSFKSAPPLAFSKDELRAIEQQEFIWWENVVRETFIRLNLLEEFSNFTDFFTEIYFYFATKEPWYIFPDVVPNLEKWRSQGIQLGIISNFDSRLKQILKVLDLEQFFTTIVISSTAGYAKPDRNIFNLALEKHNLTNKEAWHIGDSPIEDYEGAKNAGISSFWLNRSASLQNIENQLPNLNSVG